MKILYIFSHPDDESFGPAHAISKQQRQGHEVYLLTLTRGGATRQRLKFGYSIKKMGEVRCQEMQCVARVLKLKELKVMDFPDSGLKEMDPRILEKAVAGEMVRIKPDIVITDAVHGISGFHDHLVTHAVVKHAFVDLKDSMDFPKRLAYHTITEENAKKFTHFHLNGSKPDEIDCIFRVDHIDEENNQKALDCYVSYRETIDNSGIRELERKEAVFEIYAENHTPAMGDLTEGI